MSVPVDLPYNGTGSTCRIFRPAPLLRCLERLERLQVPKSKDLTHYPSPDPKPGKN